MAIRDILSFRLTQQFTRRDCFNGVLSHEKRMRHRSRYNAWFGG
jgi:hypothetical protein